VKGVGAVGMFCAVDGFDAVDEVCIVVCEKIAREKMNLLNHKDRGPRCLEDDDSAWVEIDVTRDLHGVENSRRGCC
jgi:hypothetical protein